jgi:hypothetical protein
MRASRYVSPPLAKRIVRPAELLLARCEIAAEEIEARAVDSARRREDEQPKVGVRFRRAGIGASRIWTRQATARSRGL